MFKASVVKLKQCSATLRMYTSTKCVDRETFHEFETVFSFPFIKHIATFNRLKVYHMYGVSFIIPSSGVMEILNVLPNYTFLTALYTGVTGGVLLSLASFPFRNVIGFLYISKDNNHIKISSVDFWGKRKDRVICADDWIPLLDMSAKKMDALYLSPQLADGTEFKLFMKFGNVLNATKIGEVLE